MADVGCCCCCCCFFLPGFWLEIRVEVDVDIITTLLHSPLTPPRPYVFAATYNSLFNASDSYLKSAPLAVYF